MSRKSCMAKYLREPKYAIRKKRRCRICGRSKGYYRKFDMCRLCFRELALKGEIPGIVKASW
ncbi:MAG: type Z 30S ribosomal protein S14 [Candidatus Aminicenantes bacterium]|nr:type Z 30S ribosomal protein S14 [Candidatus Aminicenantes bacterium]MDH5467133.1 type Z 30S ribosomal protein S14 [Candidatus Aminicenantes bacterium]MDH5706693.1 type Z 30S ribosomal protein S14 [Candidatus Aminicenantes bacterium]